MAQGTLNIINQGFPSFRADLNDQLEALATLSSGPTAPTATFPFQLWVDTSQNPPVLKQRNAANNAFVDLGSAAGLLGSMAVQNANAVAITGGTVAASTLTGDVLAARITDALNASGAAPIYACRAWVNFNGTGTVAIRASGNVSSVVRNGTGQYTVNFTTAMPDTNYSVGSSNVVVAGSVFLPYVSSYSTTNFTAEVRNGFSPFIDGTNNFFQIFR